MRILNIGGTEIFFSGADCNPDPDPFDFPRINESAADYETEKIAARADRTCEEMLPHL